MVQDTFVISLHKVYICGDNPFTQFSFGIISRGTTNSKRWQYRNQTFWNVEYVSHNFLDFVFGAYYLSGKRKFQETYDAVTNLHNFPLFFEPIVLVPRILLSGADIEPTPPSCQRLHWIQLSWVLDLLLTIVPTDMTIHKITPSPRHYNVVATIHDVRA